MALQAIALDHPSFIGSRCISSSISSCNNELRHALVSQVGLANRSLGRRGPSFVVQASLIPDPLKNLIKSVAKTPFRFLLQRLDDEFDKAEDKMKEGAAMIKAAANTIEKIAESVDTASDRVEELVEKVERTVADLDDELEELLEATEDEKKAIKDAATTA